MRKNYISFFKVSAVAVVVMLTSMGSINANPRKSDESKIISETQQAKITVRGVIKDKNDFIIGANIIEKGTTNGVVTNYDGEFSISVNTNATIVVSYIGYDTKEIAVNGRTTIDVTLVEDTKTLDELVVVGYGVQRKVNLSGSVASVNIEEMAEKRPISNISSALYGTAPGVYVSSGNNRPSNAGDAMIQVRGQGTLNNSSPLVVVDGVESNMSSVNPQDIASISVLKDAASSAIYGSRAANGVILITTKKGTTGVMKLEYNGYVSLESLDKPFNLITNYADYMEYMNEGLVNSKKPEQFSSSIIDTWRSHENDDDKTKYPNTDIFDVYKTGIAQQHNVSASGGTDKLTFFTSFNYLNNPGILENTGYERYSLRSNIDAQMNPWIKIGTNVNGYYATTPIISDSVDDIYTYAMSGGTPGTALLDNQNRLGINANVEDDPQNATNNPYLRLRNRAGDINTYNLKSRFYGLLTPFKGFTVQGSYSYEFWNQTKTSKPVAVPMWNFQTGTLHTDGEGRTSIMNRDEKRFRYMGDITAMYDTKVANDRLGITVLVGASQEQFSRNYHQASKNDLLDPSLWVFDGAIGEASASGNMTEWVMQSQFGRINLSWEDKYLLEANIRRDGSSRFLKDNRWGVFPSFSGAWRISEESFMKDIDWMDNLKIRASYGMLGNNALGSNKDLDGNYSAQSTYAQSNYVLNRLVVMGLSQTALANSNLTWETVTLTNFGVDFNVLRNRLGGTVEIFNKYTKDILIDLPAPRVHGNASLPRQNAAEVSNKGIEISFTWNDRIGKDFNYNVGLNLTYIKNKVEKFKGDERSISGDRMILEGYPIRTLYILEVDRLVTTDEDLAHIQSIIDNAPAGKTVFPWGRPEKGDILYKDTDKDGVLSDNDRVAIGHGNSPRFTFGFNLGAEWKGVDFSILLQGQSGLKDIYYSNLYRSTIRVGYQINKDVIDNRWYEGRKNTATYPRLLEYADTRNDRMSTLWVANKDYLKIRNIQLGYTLPAAVTKQAMIERVRIYASLENFFTFTNWKGYDPEISGVTYPTMREAAFGINVTF